MSTLQQNTAVIITFIMVAVMSSWASAQVMAPAPSPMMISGQGPSSPAPDDGSAFGPSGSGPTAPEDPCMAALLNMTDCLTYVEAGSKQAVPDKSCCPELAGLLDSNPICLCELVGSNITAQFGIQIDMGRAIKLPSVCKLSTPPTSLCAAVGYPIALPPGLAPSPGPSSTPSASSPSTGSNEKDGAAAIAVSATSLLIGLAFTFLLTFF